MPVKIRLARRGRKKQAMYDVVVADSRSPRDGKFIEKIGTYNPNTDPAAISLNEEKAFDWVMKGAQPTDTVRAMLSYRGILMKKHLQIGVIKGALSQEEADKKFEAWLSEKESKIQGKMDLLSADKAAKAKARLEAEKKVSTARAEAIAARKKADDDALVAEVAEASADEAEKELEEEGNEAVAETEAAPEAEVKEEAPAEAKAEEAPQAKVEEAPKEEAKAEEAPKEEVKAEEAPKEEVKAEEAPKEEAKKEEAPEAKAEDESSEEKKKD
ncbi:MAG: 30S ribosomal protein S16 [Marinoscillum sp.]